MNLYITVTADDPPEVLDKDQIKAVFTAITGLKDFLSQNGVYVVTHTNMTCVSSIRANLRSAALELEAFKLREVQVLEWCCTLYLC